MILHTIQPEFKYKELIDTGVLLAHHKIICEDFFENAYSWIESKMEQSNREVHPIWAWYKYKGKYFPDLRCSGHIPKGEIGYRIKFHVDEKDVLLTDFIDWHIILNSSEEDIKKGYVEFDEYTFNFDDIIVDSNSELDYIQATVWRVNKEQIISAKKFKSR